MKTALFTFIVGRSSFIELKNADRLRTAFISIACMRYRRGRPEQGVPLRAEGFPKRRCQLESVAAERRI